jgi:hypothetical protein
MNDFIIFFILRLLIFIPALVLTVVRGLFWLGNGEIHNGMKPYRLLLFLVTLSYSVILVNRRGR